MKKLLLCIALGAVFIPGNSSIAKSNYIYRQGNNPANFVKLTKFKEGYASHPYRFDEEILGDILRSFRYNKRAIFSGKIKNRRVYEENYIAKYTPYLAQAFNQASPSQKVCWSVAQKRPYYIIRNDRLTMVCMWVASDGLHADFIKTEAQLKGDYQAHSHAAKKLRQQARGIRISLEAQEGQRFGKDTKEVILDLDRHWPTIIDRIEDEEASLAESHKTRRERRREARVQNRSYNEPQSTYHQKSAEQRLQELKRLKQQGLINQRDYDRKKAEILEAI